MLLLLAGCSEEGAGKGETDEADGGGGEAAGHGPREGESEGSDPGAGPGAEPDPQPDPGDDASGGGDAGADPDPPADPLGPAVPQGYVKTCRVTCAAPAECVPAGLDPTGAHSPEHYVCNDGACQYLGCGDDEQCRDSYNDQYACKPPTAGGTPLRCTVPCLVAADCARPPPRPHTDEDNWSCLDGACLYGGCKSDDECKQGRGSDWVCRSVTGGVPTCFQTCDPAALETTPCGGSDSLFDADNHTCDGGLCIYSGCIDDADCRAYHQVENLLCR